MTKRNKIISIIACIIGILVILFLIRRDVKREVSYYKTGQLKHEVILKKGKYDGLWIDYFEDGTIHAKTDWKDGKKNGKNIIYYKNGNVRQENEYRDNICLASRDYTEDGFLEEIRIYDSLERVTDYYVYKKDGTRDFRRETKDPIFIPTGDTLVLGETYTAEIRLGNRQYDNIEVIIGDIDDPYIAKKNPPLPKKDSLTSIINIKADSLGLRSISGIVIERSATSDSLDVIPFTHRFYVKD
jgi:hypothetical protein